MNLVTCATTFVIKSFSSNVIISANTTKHETKSSLLVGQGRCFVLILKGTRLVQWVAINFNKSLFHGQNNNNVGIIKQLVLM